MILHNLLKNLRKFWNKHWRGITLFVISITLFLIPQLFWGKLYQVGGDDTRLYYLFPWDFLKNFTFNIIGDNALGIGGGYGPVSFFAPIAFEIFIVKLLLPFVNVQYFFYGLNLSLGFLFLYLLLGQIIKKSNKQIFLIKILTAILYIYSPYNIKTLYQYQLLSIYLVAVIPGVFYFFLKGLQESKWRCVLIASLVYSFFSSTMLSLPWFVAVIYSISPFIIYLIYKYRNKFFFYLFIFIVTTFFLNFYWIIHYLLGSYMTLHGLNIYSALNTKNLLLANDSAIRSLVDLNGPHSQLLSSIRVSWSSPSNIYNIGYAIIAVIIILAGVVKVNISRDTKLLYFVFFITLLWTFILFTPNMGAWTTNLFIFLNHHAPLFLSLRNMYDKFALSMSLVYSCILFISLVILTERYKRFVLYSLVFLLAIVIAYSHEFIFPPISSLNTSTYISNSFNSDFTSLVNYINNNFDKSSRFVWIPLNRANYVPIEDQYNSGHYYFGPSPLRLLANVSDYAGFSGIDDTYEPNLGGKIEEDLKEKKYNEIGYLFKRININYIILNNQQLPNNLHSFLYNEDMYRAQNDQFMYEILGRKIQDFGGRYTLYEIADKYRSQKIYLENFYQNKNAIIEYKKKSSYEYQVSVNNLTDNSFLIFLDDFYNGWQARIARSNNVLPFDHVLVDKHANGWKIDINYLKAHYRHDIYINKDGSVNAVFDIFFFPEIISWYAYAVSALSFIVVMCILVLGRVAFGKRK